MSIIVLSIIVLYTMSIKHALAYPQCTFSLVSFGRLLKSELVDAHHNCRPAIVHVTVLSFE